MFGVRARVPQAARTAEVLRLRLEEVYNLRVIADYKPCKTLSLTDVSDAVETAESLVRFAERVICS